MCPPLTYVTWMVSRVFMTRCPRRPELGPTSCPLAYCFVSWWSAFGFILPRRRVSSNRSCSGVGPTSRTRPGTWSPSLSRRLREARPRTKSISRLVICRCNEGEEEARVKTWSFRFGIAIGLFHSMRGVAGFGELGDLGGGVCDLHPACP